MLLDALFSTWAGNNGGPAAGSVLRSTMNGVVSRRQMLHLKDQVHLREWDLWEVQIRRPIRKIVPSWSLMMNR